LGLKLTSQVAITNFYGVAVASDTVSSRDTKGGLKTVTHTKKIYELGPGHEVLVLHAGSTVVNGVPAWLLVTEWAKTLVAPLETVQDYIDSFIRWASDAAPMHTPASEQTELNNKMNQIFYEVAKDTRRELQKTKEGTGKSETPHAVLTAKIELNRGWLDSMGKLDGFLVEDALKVVESFGGNFEEKVNYYFSEFDVTKKDYDALKKIIAHALIATDFNSGDDAYLAFVGFGSSQAFAVNRQIQLRAYYGGNLRYFLKENHDYAPADDWYPGVDFFAQNSAIQGFIQGYRGEIMDKLGQFIDESLRSNFADKVDDKLSEKFITEVFDKTVEFSQNTYIWPLYNEIDGMNTGRLAEFAESLVGLQATAAKIADGPATVGGLIEVVTIDKYNGIRWVKALEYN
jgi:hypothetical protein